MGRSIHVPGKPGPDPSLEAAVSQRALGVRARADAQRRGHPAGFWTCYGCGQTYAAIAQRTPTPFGPLCVYCREQAKVTLSDG